MGLPSISVVPFLSGLLVITAVGSGLAQVEEPDHDGVLGCGGIVSLREGSSKFSATLDESLRTEHFLIHYTTHGEDSVGVAYLDSVARNLELAYERFAYDPGFQMRLPRGESDPADPNAPIECYLERLEGSFGRVYGGPAIPNECEDSYSGGIIINNRLSPVNVRHTSAHEVFHLFQMREDAWESDWLDESTATWAANYLWPEGIRFEFSLDFSHEPFLPLWDDGFRWRIYGASIFWHFLDAVLEDVVAPKVWARCCTTDWFSALSQEISAKGADLDSLLVEFAKWNNALGTAADDHHYLYGDRFRPISLQASHMSYPVEAASLPDSFLAREAGSDYVRFWGRANREQLRITFNGDSRLADKRRISFIATTRPNTHREWTLAPDTNGQVTFTIEGWNLYDWVKMIVSNYASAEGLDSAAWRFTYSAEEVGALAFDVEWPASDEQLRVAPNPLSSSASIRFRVDDPGRTTRVTLYDITGRVVRRLAEGPFGRGDHTVIWDATDNDGRRAGAGVYFLDVENGSRLSKRLVLVR